VENGGADHRQAYRGPPQRRGACDQEYQALPAGPTLHAVIIARRESIAYPGSEIFLELARGRTHMLGMLRLIDGAQAWRDADLATTGTIDPVSFRDHLGTFPGLYE
jgi:hypothetical protein